VETREWMDQVALLDHREALVCLDLKDPEVKEESQVVPFYCPMSVPSTMVAVPTSVWIHMMDTVVCVDQDFTCYHSNSSTVHCKTFSVV